MKLKLLYIPRYSTSVNDATNTTAGAVPYLPPLGIATLTSFLRDQNIEVDQDDLMIKVHHHNYRCDDPADRIDLTIFNDEERIDAFIETGEDGALEAVGERILAMTRCRGFDVIGFSIYETFNPSAAGVALVLAKLLKERHSVEIIIGGVIDKRVEAKLVGTELIDCRIIGDFRSLPELNLLTFCEAFARGTPKEDIPGIVYAKNGTVVSNYVDHKNRHVLVKPTFDGLPLDIYRRSLSHKVDGVARKSQILILPYSFVRGCPFSCAFCAHSTDPSWKTKTVETIVRELTELKRDYRTGYFYFLNPEINASYRFAEALADAINASGLAIHWTDCANFRNVDSTLLRKLKKAGAVRLIFGLESASQRILDYIRKGVRADYIERMLRTASEVGIWSQLELICGFPYETEADIDATIDFVTRNAPYIQEVDVFKFWLDGLLRMHPERFGIRKRMDGPKLAAEGNRCAFVEVNGMAWDKKVAQTDRHYEKLIEMKTPLFPKHDYEAIGLKPAEQLVLQYIRWWEVVDKEAWFLRGSVA